MAKKSLLTPIKKKVSRTSKSEAYLINRKYLGEEPKFDGSVLRIEFMNALNWYNSMADESDARQYIADYLKATNRSNLAKTFNRVPYMRIQGSSVWILRMHLRGAILEGDMLELAEAKLLATLKYAEKEVEEEKVVAIRPTIQNHIANKVSDFIGDIEHTIDNLPADFSMYKTLQSSEFPASMATKVADYYRPVMQEIIDAIGKKDEQLVEAYSKYTKVQLKARLALYTGIVEDCEKYSGNLRKARKPRKKKTVPVEQKMKFFQYQKQDNAMKLNSVNPETLLGAQELWAFNTKYKTLTVFRARGPAGLDVKRTAIIGHDEENSRAKKIGRKTEELVNKVLSGGKVALRKMFDDIKTDEIKISDRINTNVILLRVVK
jgi:hypothetical protein